MRDRDPTTTAPDARSCQSRDRSRGPTPARVSSLASARCPGCALASGPWGPPA